MQNKVETKITSKKLNEIMNRTRQHHADSHG